ncbi:MAG TPA: hypothetical protein VGF69_11970 [Thermoanaerobaculia bacterium]|jgi:hypothetical protein
MKLTRLILVCTLLLLASVPAFALPQCGDCDSNNECVFSPWSGVTCGYDATGCVIQFRRCSSGLSPEATVASDWTVASIEIERPTVDSKTVTAPAAIAEVRVNQPTAQK